VPEADGYWLRAGLDHSRRSVPLSENLHGSPAHLREAVAKLDAPASADVLMPPASAPRVGEFGTISARSVSAAVESGGDCRGIS
jgi:hypothetical protein